MVYASSSMAAESRPHLFILAGEVGMETLDEATHFTPIVQSALGKNSVVVVKSAKADQPIHKWYRDMRRTPATKQAQNAGVLFANTLHRDIAQAVSAHNLTSADDFETVNFIWMQGRSDATEELSEGYADRVKGLIRQMKLFHKRHDMNSVIVRINDHNHNDKHVGRIRDAQVNAVQDLLRVAWVNTDDLNGPENTLEFTEEGYKTLGERLAKKALELIEKAPKGKHLFILSGQSNMGNLNGPVYFNPYVEAFYGKHNVAIAKRDRGGRAISLWYKNWTSAKGETRKGNGGLYDMLMTEVKSKMAGQTFDTATFIWMQGESDSGPNSAPVYFESLKGVLKQLENDLGRTDFNVVIGRINNVNADKSPSWRLIREEQVRFANEWPSGAWVSTDDLWTKKTGVHMTRDGYRILGQRYAKQAIKLLAPHTGHSWDDRLNDMVPASRPLTDAQSVVEPISKSKEKSPKKNSGWSSIISTTKRPEWRYTSVTPVNDDYTLIEFWAKHFQLIDLPEALKGWYKPGFDDSSWKTGLGPIGQPMQDPKDNATFNSAWGDGNYLLMRTTFDMENLDYEAFRLRVLTRYGHMIYLNGHLIRSFPWYTGPGKYRPKPMNEDQTIYLKHGTNTLAVYANSVGEKPSEKRDAIIDVDLEGFKHADK
ncbi:hypothetical protein BVX99_02775 [bacterium F16]|nr:hypothetical protein BVX99_02775 [bacterium F16]